MSLFILMCPAHNICITLVDVKTNSYELSFADFLGIFPRKVKDTKHANRNKITNFSTVFFQRHFWN